MKEKQNIRFIISGGGTGGHIFPAVSIAQALQELVPGAEILFVGAEGRMEMEKVPAEGYRIIGLPVRGLQRRLSLENFRTLFGLLKSLIKARKIIKEFKPSAVIGTGGYASGPVLRIAGKMGIPTLVQEQNSYPGITNRLLAKKAVAICVAYPGMEKYFPAEKIKLTGNPVRKDLENIGGKKEEAMEYFGMDRDRRTIVVLGGSLGARTVNNAILSSLDKIGSEGDIQMLWQCGKLYHEQAVASLKDSGIKNIKLHAFISRMDLAYALADMLISRAGASTISEISLCEKASILVPSPNVAEDHQTHNAMALVDRSAAEIVRDAEAGDVLVDRALELAGDKERLAALGKEAGKMAVTGSAGIIAKEIMKHIN